MTWARRMRVGGASRKLVLLVLADQADNYGFVSEHCTQAEIAAESELSERQVRRLLRELSPWFEREHRPGEGQGRGSDVFRLKMKEMPTIVGVKPRQPDNMSAMATGHSTGGNRTNATGQMATGHLPHTPSKNPISKRSPKGDPKGSFHFDALWALWRTKDLIRRAKRKPAFDTFERLVRGGADPQRILAGARSYLASAEKTAEGGKFMPDLFRWLRDEVWADWSEEDFSEALRIWSVSERAYWDRAKYGPAPNEPGYRGPPLNEPTDLFAAGAKP